LLEVYAVLPSGRVTDAQAEEARHFAILEFDISYAEYSAILAFFA
jgi:hypothetical protein